MTESLYVAPQPEGTELGFCPSCVRMRWITSSGVCTGCEREALDQAAREDDREPGLSCCLCGNLWNPLRMRGLADVTCPNCGAGYADVGRNAEP